MASIWVTYCEELNKCWPDRKDLRHALDNIEFATTEPIIRFIKMLELESRYCYVDISKCDEMYM